MDQIKIGKFIQERRKLKNITQSELAEKLYISDRAISKWENGICLPDASNIEELCKLLDISINDLFSGEVVDMKDNEKRLEENLIEMTKAKELSDKRMLNFEIVLGATSCAFLLILIGIACLLNIEEWQRLLIIVIGMVVFLVGVLFALRIEQIAGYYECDSCHHKYIPSYKKMLFAQHAFRSRKMRCPKCGKKTWQKKVIR